MSTPELEDDECDAALDAQHPLARPIFVPDYPDTIDEAWTWGALIGGLITVEGEFGIARQYKAAADRLVEQGIKDDDLNTVAMPILFLYRQAIENALKAVLGPPTPPDRLDHDLAKLLDRMQARFGPMPSLIRERILEFHTNDARGDAFRFTEKSRSKKGENKHHFPEEVWVDLRHLSQVVDVVIAGLAKARGQAAPA